MAQPLAITAAARRAPTRCVVYNPHFPAAYQKRLAELAPEAQISVWSPPGNPAVLADAEVLFTTGLADPRPLVRHMPKLRWIHSLSAGVERLMVPEVVERRILLTNSSGCAAVPIAEHVIAAILAFARQLPGLMAQQRRSGGSCPPERSTGRQC